MSGLAVARELASEGKMKEPAEVCALVQESDELSLKVHDVSSEIDFKAPESPCDAMNEVRECNPLPESVEALTDALRSSE